MAVCSVTPNGSSTSDEALCECGHPFEEHHETRTEEGLMWSCDTCRCGDFEAAP